MDHHVTIQSVLDSIALHASFEVARVCKVRISRSPQPPCTLSARTCNRESAPPSTAWHVINSFVVASEEQFLQQIVEGDVELVSILVR